VHCGAKLDELDDATELLLLSTMLEELCSSDELDKITELLLDTSLLLLGHLSAGDI